MIYWLTNSSKIKTHIHCFGLFTMNDVFPTKFRQLSHQFVNGSTI